MSDNDKIFIEPVEAVKEETTIEKVEEAPKVSEEPKPKPDGRKGKSKRIPTQEQKDKLVANLAKGRAKSLETRRRNRELKKIEKETKLNGDEKLILESLQKKKNKSKDSNELLDKISELQKKLDEKEKVSIEVKEKPKVLKKSCN